VTTVPSLSEIAQRYEELYSSIAEQLFNQSAGLPYDAGLMLRQGKQIARLCERFLSHYREPRLMRLGALESVAEAARLPHRLELAEKRLKIISTDKYTIRGRNVTWASWRQFNAATDDSKARQEVFDIFVSKAPKLASLIQRQFEAANQAYAKYDTSPLTVYLDLEGMSYQELTGLVERLGDGARQPFLRAAEHYSQEIKGEPMDYYDDFYYFRGRLFQSLNNLFTGLNPLSAVQEVLGRLGFPVNRISVDGEDRPKKSPSAFCFAIRVPQDVRVVYKPVSPISDFGSLFHEFGHGIHGISGRPQDPPWKRYIVSRSVSETFSILIESLLSNPLFLTEDLGLSPQAAQEVVDRRHFIELYFVVFYAANSLMKLAYWHEGFTPEEASKRWQELTRRFFIEIPGDYWLLHHVMPDYLIYSPSYMIAAVRVTSLEHQLAREFGDRWWRQQAAGEYIAQLAATRGEFPIDQIPLRPDNYLSKISAISML